MMPLILLTIISFFTGGLLTLFICHWIYTREKPNAQQWFIIVTNMGVLFGLMYMMFNLSMLYIGLKL